MGPTTRYPSTPEEQNSLPTLLDFLLLNLQKKSSGKLFYHATTFNSLCLISSFTQVKAFTSRYDLSFVWAPWQTNYHLPWPSWHPSCFWINIACIFRAWFYCKACHEDIKDENLIKKCKCKNCKYRHPYFYHFYYNAFRLDNFRLVQGYFLCLLISIC